MCNLEFVKKHYGEATPTTLRYCRMFICPFLTLLVLVPLRFAFVLEFIKEVPHVFPNTVDRNLHPAGKTTDDLRKSDHGEAKEFLLSTTYKWQTETFITGLSLST